MEIVILLRGDNQKYIVLVHNPVFHSITKYIDIQYYYIRDQVAYKRIKLSYILTEEMIAEKFMKALIYLFSLGFVDEMRMI